jgi:hypothetical protein
VAWGLIASTVWRTQLPARLGDPEAMDNFKPAQTGFILHEERNRQAVDGHWSSAS